MATESELRWASSYDGYARVAQDWHSLTRVLSPALHEYGESGRVPGWCGVDLLRAWAFYRQREHHHEGHGPITAEFDDVLAAIRRHPMATASDLPPVATLSLPDDWSARLSETLGEPYWTALGEFVASERLVRDVLPPADRTFRAFELTPFDAVKVVILGQDPYPTPGNADGLAFSVSDPSARTPASLANIFAELVSDVGVPTPTTKSLDAWARQGVLLLNTALTLRAGIEADHAAHRRWRHGGKGWGTFTDAVISGVSARPEPVVFILWGADARKKARLIDAERHCVLESVHPSPLSASKGFFGSKPFSRANEFLRRAGRGEIDWSLAA